jgi:hypothetical protein
MLVLYSLLCSMFLAVFISVFRFLVFGYTCNQFNS